MMNTLRQPPLLQHVCFRYECQKAAANIIAHNKADYLLIDTCDCRSDWYQLKTDSECRICQSLTADKTIQENALLSELFERISIFSLSNEQWKKYVNDFCTLILTMYDEEHIILNEFRFAEFYLKDGELLRFDRWEMYRKLNRITDLVAEMIKERLPNIKVISAFEKPTANFYHHIGNSTVHYIDEVYLEQARKLESLISQIKNDSLE